MVLDIHLGLCEMRCDTGLKGIEFFFLVKCVSILELSSSIWESSWRGIPFLLWFQMSCSASHYFIGRYLVIWIRIYLWGIKSPPESLFGYLCPSVDDDCCKSEVHTECSKSVAGGLRWPASTTDAGDARYRDSEFCLLHYLKINLRVPVGLIDV